jgi:hypothetical protein
LTNEIRCAIRHLNLERNPFVDRRVNLVPCHAQRMPRKRSARNPPGLASRMVPGRPKRSPAQAPLRTVRESFPSHGSSLSKISLG